MPHLSGKMNERERQICARVRTIREAVGWSQSNFANALSMGRDKLASVEYGRTPLKSKEAFAMAALTGFSLRWLAEGDGPKKGPLPSPELIDQVAPGSLFSSGWDKRLKGIKTSQPSNGRPKGGAGVLDYSIEEITGTMKLLPPELHDNFFAHLTQSCRDFVKMNLAEISRLSAESGKNELTKTSLKSKTSDVKSELDKLIERVKRLVSRPGAKAELARFLDVAPARVTEWLSDDSATRKEPGGYYALELLKWARQQEHQK